MSKKRTDTYLSVVIPTCDRPNLLVSAVRSVPRNVTEIVIVNDGTSSIAPDVQADPRVTIVHSGPRRGPSAARNVGVYNARGKIILFLDDDDQFNERYVDRVLSISKSQNNISSGFSAVIETVDGKFCAIRRKFRKSGAILSSRPRNIIHAASAGFWIRKDKFLEIGGFDESLRVDEDTDLCIRLFNSDGGVWYDTEPGVLFRVKSGIDQDENKITEQAIVTDISYKSYRYTLLKNYDASRPLMKFFLINRTIRRGMKDIGRIDNELFSKLSGFWWFFAHAVKFKYVLRHL